MLGEAEDMADTQVPEVDEPMAMRWSVGRVLAVIAALAIIAFWAWIFAGGPRKMNKDRLQDEAWVETSIERCERMLDELDDVPSAAASKTQAERSRNVLAANEVIAAMVDDLERTAPTDEQDREVLDEWFKDWRVYLSDRANYAERVLDDPAARFQVTENEKLGRGVDDTIRTFADVNDMKACRPPGDVG